MSSKILVVDDEKDIREVVSMLLEREGYSVSNMASGFEAAAAIKSGESFSLIIMDIAMPDMDGIETVKKIRETSLCPVLFLTAKSSDEDKIKAFSVGDDFLAKPFSRVELVLRVKSLLRRCEEASADIRGVLIDTENQIVKKDGEIIKLTDKEYEVLQLLYLNRGETLKIEDIYEQIWHEDFTASSSNTVMVHILNLRKKLEDDFARPELIMTKWGKGYYYAEKNQSVTDV